MFNQKAAEGLKAFVEKGGYVLSEARLAWNDERGYTSAVIPGLGLSEVFGVRESKVKTLSRVLINVTDNSHPSMEYLKSNDTLIGSLFAESLEPLKSNKSARVLATLEDNSPCIVTATYGKGQTMYVGSFLALANSRGALWDQSTQRLTVQDSANKKTDNFLQGLVNWAKIKRPFNVVQSGKADNPLVVRLQKYSEGYLLYILNHGKTNEKATIRLNVEEEGTYLLEELMRERKIEVATQNRTVEFNTSEISFKNGEIWCIQKVKE